MNKNPTGDSFSSFHPTGESNNPQVCPHQSFIPFFPGRCRMRALLLWGPQQCWFYSKQWAAFLPEANLPPGKPHLREPEGGPEDVEGLKKKKCDWGKREWHQEKKMRLAPVLLNLISVHDWLGGQFFSLKIFLVGCGGFGIGRLRTKTTHAKGHHNKIHVWFISFWEIESSSCWAFL